MTLDDISTFEEDSNGDLAIPVTLIYGIDAIRQEILAKFSMFRGEHFLDKRLGIPYRRDILKKGASRTVVRAIYKKVVLLTKGVQSLIKFEIVRDTATRTMAVNFEARLTNGQVLRSQPDEFLISRG